MTTQSPVQPGDVLVGKYRVDRVLGMGQMGIVVAATHLGLGTRVALKFMLATKGPEEEPHARFLREVRASVALKSEHVARVSDVGTLPSGAPYMVMEYLDGRDLDAVLRDRVRLPAREAVLYVLQACEAVAEAHAAGIIHRDLKPANLFLTRDARGDACVKVLDFGVSKFTSEALKLTQEGTVVGSPLYMAPEQLKDSKAVDPRCDIWALGVVLFELLTGRTPFHADRIPELCARVWFGEPDTLSKLAPDAPAGIEPIILRCLEKDPARRFANVAQLAAALAPYAPEVKSYAQSVASVLGVDVAAPRPTDPLPVDAAVVGASPLAGSGPGVAGSASSPISLEPRVPEPRRARRRGTVAVALAAAALLGLAGAGLWARMRTTASVARSIATGAPSPAQTASPAPAASPTPEPAVSAPEAVHDPAADAASTADAGPVSLPAGRPRGKAPAAKQPPAGDATATPRTAPQVKPPSTTYNL